MRGGPSWTAQAVCWYRAAELRRSDRILEDPWSERFLGPAAAALLYAPVARPLIHGFRGLGNTIALRHRFIDDEVERSIRSGVTDVLLLGAGYDTRPWRFADRIGLGRFWEVDHPATAAAKVARARKMPTAQVVRLSCDFESQRLADVLRDGGFPFGSRVMVVWEGVTMYLSRPAVVETLDTLHHIVGRGSNLVADFWQAPSNRIQRLHAAVLGAIGEPLTFPLAPTELSALVEPLGWGVEKKVTASDLADQYARERHVYPSSWLAVLTATEPN